jgi:hypothetical protein
MACGAFVRAVRNHGPVTTCGANAMVLDNCGVVGRRLAQDKVTSYGRAASGS